MSLTGIICCVGILKYKEIRKRMSIPQHGMVEVPRTTQSIILTTNAMVNKHAIAEKRVEITPLEAVISCGGSNDIEPVISSVLFAVAYESEFRSSRIKPVGIIKHPAKRIPKIIDIRIERDEVPQ